MIQPAQKIITSSTQSQQAKMSALGSSKILQDSKILACGSSHKDIYPFLDRERGTKLRNYADFDEILLESRKGFIII